jgi:hypothetical protein
MSKMDDFEEAEAIGYTPDGFSMPLGKVKVPKTANQDTGVDEKLRAILQEPHKDSMGTTVMTFPTQKLLDQIKQAFADEGYKKHDKAGCIEFDYDDEQRANMVAIIMSKMNFKEPVMTGQEWYDRFMAELKNFKGIDELHNLDDAMVAIRQREQWAEEATRKAAGL